MIATIPHVITPGAYASRLMTECVCRYWWAIAVPVVPCLIAGCYDLRFLIVAAAWLLIVMPGILALVYFRYALSPEAAKMTLPHIVTFADDTITVTWPDTDYPPLRIPKADVRSVEDTGSALVVAAPAPLRPLIIPVKSFPSPDDATEAFRLLN